MIEGDVASKSKDIDEENKIHIFEFLSITTENEDQKKALIL